MSPVHEHKCKQAGKASLLFLGIGIALAWMFNTVWAGELERREMRTKLEAMVEDISAIRAVLEKSATFRGED